jgi:hypothetical protein
VVVIDEHTTSEPATRVQRGQAVHRELFELRQLSATKSLFMLTATRSTDSPTSATWSAVLAARRNYFARTLGINNLRAHFGNLEGITQEFDDQVPRPRSSSRRRKLTAAHLPGARRSAQPRIREEARSAKSTAQRSGAEAAASHLLDPEDVRRCRRCRPRSRSKPLFSLAIYYARLPHGWRRTGQGACNREEPAVPGCRADHRSSRGSSLSAVRAVSDRLLDGPAFVKSTARPRRRSGGSNAGSSRTPTSSATPN